MSARELRDDLGAKVMLPEQVTRIVSLVPSLTEAVEATMPGTIIAATDWCTHPANLDVTRIRGTKNPDVAAIIEMKPDLVIANEEENKPEHIAEHLYTAGQPDPDLVIRTSGEQRLSGFLLWQSAHSEFYFCEAYWPDFRHVDFLRALRAYAARGRRYGA